MGQPLIPNTLSIQVYSPISSIGKGTRDIILFKIRKFMHCTYLRRYVSLFS